MGLDPYRSYIYTATMGVLRSSVLVVIGFHIPMATKLGGDSLGETMTDRSIFHNPITTEVCMLCLHQMQIRALGIFLQG